MAPLTYRAEQTSGGPVPLVVPRAGVACRSIYTPHRTPILQTRYTSVTRNFTTPALRLICSLSVYTRCPFHTYTASSWDLVSFPRKRASRRRAHGDWMPAYAGMTFYWYRTYEMDI